LLCAGERQRDRAARLCLSQVMTIIVLFHALSYRNSFIDSTSLKVGHNRRIQAHKVFVGCARRGKTRVDWCFGFKRHLVTNDCGELLGVRRHTPPHG
jgi:hypothetical protein